ncbi:Cell division protein SepF [Chlamydia abortus]|jgi:cell division inhibitor SepF|uniref:Cell division protein SepF n=1 Tax=Paenibacillus residui TaxID=629724 RepID=A0ABW3DHD2_9BACL|nr:MULTISPECIES: cell division protein SepF [Paenibacillaceae]SHE10471.1 Cell division protein SepF [Chlamydia abortus]
MGVMNKFLNFIGLQEEEEVVEKERGADSTPDPEPNMFDGRKNKNNIVSIHSQKNIRVILSEPRSYDETQDIADHLRSRRPVVVNLQRLRSDQAIRIVDFLSGTVYALNGSISKIGPSIFLCTPDTVEIQGSIKDSIEDEADYNK